MAFSEGAEAGSPLRSNKMAGSPRRSRSVLKALRFQQDHPVNFQVSRNRRKKQALRIGILSALSICFVMLLVLCVVNWIFLLRNEKILAEIALRLQGGTPKTSDIVVGTSRGHSVAGSSSVEFSGVFVPQNASVLESQQANKPSNITKAPLTLLVELVQRGARFTCDVVCDVPRVIKTLLRVNSESQSWEGFGSDIDDAKQEASYRALKELYAPHIVAEVYYQPKNFTFECLLHPELNANSTLLKSNKKC